MSHEEKNEGTRYALISTYDKTHIGTLARMLVDNGYQILSTGGTFKKLAEILPKKMLTSVSDFTEFSEILDGRVKTLHPKIYGGLLAQRSKRKHLEELTVLNIPLIDIVVCNLYPFYQAAEQNLPMMESQELIDIGGVTLIRAAAKNWQNVLVLTDPTDYPALIENNFEDVSRDQNFRHYLAVKAFQMTSQYDSLIAGHLNSLQGEGEMIEHRFYQRQMELKYGCNPHQGQAALYQILDQHSKDFPISLINGTAGYINLLDAMNAWQLVSELRNLLNLPAVASFKHTSPAGAAVANPLSEILRRTYSVPDDLELTPLASAFIRARNADPMSSFGDFIALSDCCDVVTAQLIKREISDGVIAPDYTPEALEILCSKRGGKYLILKMDSEYRPQTKTEYREINGLGFSQERNLAVVDYEVFTDIEKIPTLEKNIPPEAQRDLLLATITLKYAQSNNVVYACDGQVIGVAAGQQSRVDCVKLGGRKVSVWYLRQHPKTQELWNLFRKVKRQEKINAIVRYVEGDFTPIEYESWKQLFVKEPEPLTLEEKNKWLQDLTGVSLSSDAFFPFRDNIDHASKYGVKYVMQPGGSLADQNVTEACNDYQMVMVKSGVRMFTH